MCVCTWQAQARCHRIGQNKAVKVYRLITRNSYEREMFDRASLKLGLDKAVLQSMSGRDNSLGGGTGGGVSLTTVHMVRWSYKFKLVWIFFFASLVLSQHQITRLILIC